MFSRSWMFCLSALVALALGLCACAPKGTNATAEDTNAEPKPAVAQDEIAITHYGQGAFLLADQDRSIVISPHDDRVGYAMEEITADVVLIRDNPAAREQAKVVEGEPEIIDKVGEREVKEVTFRAIAALRGAKEGAEPEKDIIYAFELSEVKFCHLGGLGTKLTDQQVKAIGPVDVLMIPVGGGTALDAEGAWAVIGQLKPKMVLPMHYQTEKTKAELGLQPLDPFKELASEKDETGKPRAIVLGGGHTMVVSKARLPTAVCILYALKPW